MLYDRWRAIARDVPSELALRDVATGCSWTFAELDAAAQAPPVIPHIAFPQGNGPEFVIEVLRAWRHERIVCPLESGQAAPRFSERGGPGTIPLPGRNIAHLKMTSATSGAAKVVAFTADQLAADAENIISTMGLRRDWPNLGFISLAHSYGFSNLVTPLLLHGIPLIMGGPPLPELVRQASETVRDATLAAVPALWRVWNETGAIRPSIRIAISAGAALPLSLETDVFARHGLKIHNFYGASECGGIAYDASGEPRAEPECIGTPIHNVSVTINEAECLEVRGQNVGETYWPEASSSLQAGVYRTTDLAELRAGKVWLRGRASDVINVAGRKIAPETIERTLAGCPGVRECVVFGIPSSDLQRGDTIVACVAAQTEITSEMLRTYLLQRSEAWQVPRVFWMVDTLGTNHRGKISRAEWRARFLAERPA